MFEEIKRLLVSFAGDESFDGELELFMGSVMGTLADLGVIPHTLIWDKELTWEKFQSQMTNQDPSAFGMVKVYILLKVRILFDPPTGAGAEFARASIAEMEWRIREFYGGGFA